MSAASVWVIGIVLVMALTGWFLSRPRKARCRRCVDPEAQDFLEWERDYFRSRDGLTAVADEVWPDGGAR